MIPMDSHFGPPSTSTTGLVFPANYSVSGLHPAVDSPVAGGIKPEAALVMDWSPEEQYVLDNGLAKLTNEPKVSKYVKIAATLPDKTVRDVALRCRWMTGKRRKRKENSAGKSISNRKVVDTSPELISMLANVPQQNALYVMNNMCHSTHMPHEGSSDAVLDLLQQNAQAFSQISYNLSVCKQNGVQVKVIAGESMGIQSPVYTRTPTMFLDFTLDPGAQFHQNVPESWNAFAYVLESGEGGAVFGSSNSSPVSSHNVVVFGQGNDGVSVWNKSSSKKLRFVLIAGEPIDEPVVQYGPFVMNTQAEIDMTIEDYHYSKNGFEMAEYWRSQ